MSSVNWQKVKSTSQGKAQIKHNDKEERYKTNHENPDIDKTKTSLNLEFQGRDHKAKCDAYDSRVEFCKSNMRRVRSDAVTLICLNAKLPGDLNEAPYSIQCAWMNKTYELMRDFVGEDNVISATADFDEVHRYLDPETKQYIMSRPEIDVKFVPELNGTLNAKLLQTKARMIDLNNRIEVMTQQEFGCKFQTGAGAKHKSTDKLKNESIKAEREQLEIHNEKLKQANATLYENNRGITQDINAKRSEIESLNRFKTSLNVEIANLSNTTNELRKSTEELLKIQNRASENVSTSLIEFTKRIPTKDGSNAYEKYKMSEQRKAMNRDNLQEALKQNAYINNSMHNANPLDKEYE